MPPPSLLKRFFFGYQVEAPWPGSRPGSLVAEEQRHITLAFLGMQPEAELLALASSIPTPLAMVAPSAIFDRCLFLPEKKPRVVAWHLVPFSHPENLIAYQQQLADYLTETGYKLAPRPFLPHVTLAHKEWEQSAWEAAFQPIPLYASHLHLYESRSERQWAQYTPRWSYPLIPPFIRVDHTADIAFQVQATTLSGLFLHAQLALTFECPELVPFLDRSYEPANLDGLISALNRLITRADIACGIGLKAVSLHGEVREQGGLLTWQMIVDV